MKQSTKTVIIFIGMVTLLAGVYKFIKGGELFEVGLAIFFGLCLLGTIYADKQR